MSAPEQSILREAEDLICGPRNGTYGPAEEDFPLVADMFNAWLKARYRIDADALDAEDVAMFMVFLKIRRQGHQRKRDNITDAIGYLALAYRVGDVDGKYETDAAAI